MKKNIYQENGFADRKAYLLYLADQYGVSLFVICSLSEMLGEDEDFDALPTTLEDYGNMLAG